MNIEVRADPQDPAPHRGRLRARGRAYPCALGRAGIRADKREGDGATPAGCFPLREVLYRADRLGLPATRLPARPLDPMDGWCDDPAHGDYNRRVLLPFGGGAEALWREDGLYDVIVVIGYNEPPPVAGAGSAIFLHAAAPGLPATEGCVALALDDLIPLVAALAPGDTITII